MQQLAIRPATGDDAEAIRLLAQLDSALMTPAAEGALVAESSGRIVAAVGADGTAVADPFHPTAALVAFMRSQGAAQLASAAPATPVISLRRRPRGMLLRRLAA